MLGSPQHLLLRTPLHTAPAVHHQHVVRDVGDDAEVVGDEDDRGAGLLLELLEQVHDLGLHGDVQRRRRLVGDQQRGVADQRHGDHRALAHTAGELVRIVVHPQIGLRDAHLGQHLHGPRPGLPLGGPGVLAVRLTDLLADGVVRREGGQRVLEDHGHLVAAQLFQFPFRRGEEVLPVEQDLALYLGVVGVVQSEDGQVGHGLAGAGLADDAEGPAALDVEGQPVDGLDHAVVGGEVHAQIAYGEEGGAHWISP